MLNMLIVDDNNRDCRVLQQILPWEEYGIQVTGVARDGVEALEILRRQPQDIVITDISMPRMNGLELAKELEIVAPLTYVIFISCYSDFEYAKQAVNLNVFGYINKPLNRDELNDIAVRVANDCHTRKRKEENLLGMQRQLQSTLPMAQEEFLRRVLLGNIPDKLTITKNARFISFPVDHTMNYQVAVLRIEAGNEEENLQKQHYLMDSLKQWVASRSEIFGTQYLIRLTQIWYALVRFDFGKDVQECGNRTLEMVSKLIEYGTEECRAKMTAGISKTISSIDKLHELYEQSVAAFNSKFYTLELPIVLYENTEEIEKSEPPSFSEMAWNSEIWDVIESGSKEGVEQFADRYFSAEGKRFSSSFYRQRAVALVGRLFVILTEQSFSLEDIHCGSDVMKKINDFHTIYEMNSWVRELLMATVSLVHGENASRDEKLVMAIKKMIHMRYMEQITVEEISKCVYYSSKQANSIFRRVTGITIFDYLVEYRIEIAKKLLRDPGNRIYWIAEQVGYQNKSHFALVFKKVTGLTPIDYRNQSKYGGEG